MPFVTQKYAASLPGLSSWGRHSCNSFAGRRLQWGSTISTTVSWLLCFRFSPLLPSLLIDYIGGYSLFPIMIMDAAVIATYIAFRSRINRRVYMWLAESPQRRQNTIVSWLFQPTPLSPTFIASMARDEASLLLRAADIISALPWFLFELPALVGASLITSSIVMMFASFGIYGDTVDEIGSSSTFLCTDARSSSNIDHAIVCDHNECYYTRYYVWLRRSLKIGYGKDNCECAASMATASRISSLFSANPQEQISTFKFLPRS